jgi:predicted transcriptional regulator
MPPPRLTRLEFLIMEDLWTHGPSAVREVQERIPDGSRPAYTTVQSMIYRLEAKAAVRRTKKIGNAHVFEAAISRASAQRRLVDDLLGLFGGRAQPVMAHMIDTGKLTLDDVLQAERRIRDHQKKGKRP